MRPLRSAALAVGMLVGLAAVPAAAQIDIESSVGIGVGDPGYEPEYDPGYQPGYDVVPAPGPYEDGGDAYEERRPLDGRDAEQIALAHGLVSIEEVRRRGDDYRVEGRDVSGDHVEMTIDGDTGAVVDIDD